MLTTVKTLRVFTSAYLCVCLFIHMISKKRILDHLTWHRNVPKWVSHHRNPCILGSRSRVTKTLPAWVFGFLWVLASSWIVVMKHVCSLHSSMSLWNYIIYFGMPVHVIFEDCKSNQKYICDRNSTNKSLTEMQNCFSFWGHFQDLYWGFVYGFHWVNLPQIPPCCGV